MADKTRTVRGTLNAVDPGVIVAAANYSALDVFSNHATTGTHWVFANPGRNEGGAGIIRHATIIANAPAMVAKVRLWLFNAAPTTTVKNDNVAFDLKAADRAKVIGYFDFPALVDVGDVAYAQNSAINLPFKLADGSTSLYGITQFIDAEVNEVAGMTVGIELGIEID